jgi:hypothetical protein
LSIQLVGFVRWNVYFIEHFCYVKFLSAPILPRCVPLFVLWFKLTSQFIFISQDFEMVSFHLKCTPFVIKLLPSLTYLVIFDHSFYSKLALIHCALSICVTV